MRTKNLNLKKKIAFIASVAMIASTAAYLPNEVAKDIFNASITANATTYAEAQAIDGIYVKFTVGAGVEGYDAGTYWYAGEGKVVKGANATTIPAGAENLSSLFQRDATPKDDGSEVAVELKTATTLNLPSQFTSTATVGVVVPKAGQVTTENQTAAMTPIAAGVAANGSATKATSVESAGYSASTTGYKETVDFQGLSFAAYSVQKNLFKAYVQVNGKFIGRLTNMDTDSNGTVTKTYPLYKYFDSLEDMANANTGAAKEKYTPFSIIEGTDGATGTTPVTAVLTASADTEYNDSITNDMFVVANANKAYGAAITLPSIVKSTDKVTVKIVPNDIASGDDRKAIIEDEDSVAVTMDNFGYGQIKKGASIVTVLGANYKDKDGNESGDKEQIDLSGLKFAIEADTLSKTPKITKSNGKDITENNTLVQPNADKALSYNVELVTDPEAILGDDTIEEYQYKRMSVDGTYCNTFVAKLATAVDPGKQIIVDFDKKNSEEYTGTTDGKVTLRMGADGVAKSGVIGVTDATTGLTTNYVLVVLNAETGAADANLIGSASNNIANGKTWEEDTFFTGIAGLEGTKGRGHKDVKGFTDWTGVANNTDTRSQTLKKDTTGNIKVTSEQVAMQTLKGEKFVQKYTIATNDPVLDYSVDDTDDFDPGKRHCGFEMKVPGKVKLAANAANDTQTQYYLEFQSMGTPDANNTVWTDGNKIGIKQDLTNSYDIVKFFPKAGEGANYTTPIMVLKKTTYSHTVESGTAGQPGYTAPVDTWTEGEIVGYVQFDFTTKYDLPIYNASEDNGIDVDTSKIIGYAKVGEKFNGMEVTRPENAQLGGWSFVQYNIVNDDVLKKADAKTGDGAGDDTTAADGQDATNGNKYTYSKSANAAGTGGQSVNTDSNKIFKLYSSASDVQSVNKSWTNYSTNINKVTPNSYIVAEYEAGKYNIEYDGNGGYFTAAQGVTLEENKDGNTTKSLVEDVTSGKDDKKAVAKTGNTLATNVKRDGYTFKGWNTDKDATTGMTQSAFEDARPSEKNGKVTLYAIWKADEVTINWLNLDFDSKGRSLVGSVSGDFTTKLNGGIIVNEDSSVEYKAGEKFGSLPTPTLRGYTFDGWYLKDEKVNSKTNVTEYSAVPVTEDTVIDSEYIDKDKVLNLYAKFKQDSYTITADYGTGKLDWVSELTPKGTGDDKTWELKNAGSTYSVTDKEYKAGPAEIATYKYNAKDEKVLFFDANDKDITDNVTNIYDVKDGSGEYNVFQGFYINDDTTAIKFADLSTQLAGFAKLDDLKLTAHFEAKKNNSTGSMYLDTNGGEFYICKSKSFTSPSAYFTNEAIKFNGGGSKNKDRLISSELTIDKNTVKYENPTNKYVNSGKTDAGTNVKLYNDKTDSSKFENVTDVKDTGYYVVARPGYTFTGWYTTPDCKTEFDFKTAKYEEGVEHKAYAGWKANNTTRYTLRFNLMNKNGSFIPFDSKKDADNPGSQCTTSSEYEFETSFMGTTGTLAKASEKEFEWNGKTYVFDAVRSGDAVSSKTINAEYEVEGKNADTKGGLDCLYNGKFALDVDEYTVIEGVFVEKGTELQPEETETGDLEAATDVKVAGGVVTWKAAKGAASYRYKVIDKNGKVKYAAATVKGTSQTLAVADIPADDYKLAVIAIAKDGKTTKTTQPIEVKVAKTNLTAPTDVKWADGVLTWKASTDAHHYNVKKVYANGNVKYVGGTADATLDLAAESVDFTAYVIAVDANGKTATSTKGAKVAADTKKVLGVVTDAKYDAKDNTVSWTAVANAKSYNICKMVNGKKFWVTGVKDTSYKFENKTPAFNYYVVAVAEDGDYTIGTFNAYPTMATDVVVTEGSKNVTWTAAEGAKYYKIGKVSADGKKVVWNNNKIEGTKGTFSYACTAGQKVVVMAVFKDEAKNLQTTRSATVVAAAAKADK